MFRYLDIIKGHVTQKFNCFARIVVIKISERYYFQDGERISLVGKGHIIILIALMMTKLTDDC